MRKGDIKVRHETKEDPGRVEFLNVDLPFTKRAGVKIGCAVEYCPNCQMPLSFFEGKPFCRCCHKI